MQTFFDHPTEAVMRSLGSREQGLRTSEVVKRQQEHGRNILQIRSEPLWRIIIEPFMNVFVGVLIAAAILSIAMQHSIDAVIIGVIIVISAGIYYAQRYSTERVLRALRSQDRQYVSARRDGKAIDVSAEDLVAGDVIVLVEGEKVPADARVIHADNVRTDESLLTGESTPVDKYTRVLSGSKEIYEQSNMLFQGSYVVSGEVVAVVTAIGSDTEFGRLARLAAPQSQDSPAQQKINSFVNRQIIAIGVVSVLIFALSLYRGIDVFESLRFVLAMSVAAVPEGLPVAITVILVLGMRHMARYKALARSMRAVENIGIVTTIATDKTGTLTKNKLSVHDTWQASRSAGSLPLWLMLAANPSVSSKGDPLDGALIDYASAHRAKIPKARSLDTGLSFDRSMGMSGNVWRVGDRYEVVVKGAPEKVLQHCKISDTLEKSISKHLKLMTGSGYRVLVVARYSDISDTIDSLSDLSTVRNMTFVAIVAVADEIRAEAAPAIRDAIDAGITVRMITGDHAETAFAIGKQIGLVSSRREVLDCRTVGRMSDSELKRRVDQTKVFARVLPEMKYRILGALKRHNVTAMTGDGVNDVPALTNAHVGIAMGSGSQIAREAGDIVLLDDNFATIIQGVRGGRVIFDNVRRMLMYLLATSIGEVLVMVGALVLGLPLPVVAVQLLWVNLVTDTALVIPLGLEKAESDVMKRPPRPAAQAILERQMIIRLILVSSTMAVVILGAFHSLLHVYELQVAQTIAFVGLVTAQWANALNARSEWTSLFVRARVLNKPMIAGFAIAILLQAIVMVTPLGQYLYIVDVPIWPLIATCTASFVAVILAVEIHKLCYSLYNKYLQTGDNR